MTTLRQICKITINKTTKTISFSQTPFSGYSVDRKVAKVMPYSGLHEEVEGDEEAEDPLATNEPNQVSDFFFKNYFLSVLHLPLHLFSISVIVLL